MQENRGEEYKVSWRTKMKYDDNHVREFEGAKGKCGICGLVVELDHEDRPRKLFQHDSVWRVECPHCGSTIECTKSWREKK